MNKKTLLGLAATLAALAGVVAFSGFEAHVINVTAHIENALSVTPKELQFGTVFPQEYINKEFTIGLSDSFESADRVDDVSYSIKHKPKCKANDSRNPIQYAPVDYATELCPEGYTAMLDLCAYLSVTPQTEETGDIGIPSYFHGQLLTCSNPSPNQATGRLSKNKQDIDDAWVVDLKVPPIKGFVGQDWPASCPTLLDDSKDYGCDLWVEVTGISEKLSCIPSAEICDGLDNDCDGQIDEGCPALSLFEYYSIGDNDVNSVADTKWEAQTFTPQITHIIKKVKIKIYRLGLPGIVSVGIRATDAEGKPTGTDLASGTIDGNTFTTDSSGAWYDIDLGNGTILYSGIKYAIVLGNSASGWARWRVAVPSSYEGGTSLTSFDSGNTWGFCTGGDGGYDTLFEEWGI